MFALNSDKDLVDKAIKNGDIYAAAAVYSIAKCEQREVLEGIMFAKRRDALALARWEHTPAEVLNALSIKNNSDVGIVLRLDKNQNTPALAISTLFGLENGQVKRNTSFTVMIAQHRHTPINVLEAIVKFVDDIEVLKAVSKNPVANAQVLGLLLNRVAHSSVYEAVAKNVAANPSASADLLSAIYSYADYSQADDCQAGSSLRVAVLKHENCPQFLIRLAEFNVADAAIEIQRQLVKDSRLSLQALASLVASQDKVLRTGLAANLAAPKMLIKQLLKDESPLVRRAVAARADLTVSSIKYLISDKDHWVRQWLARNPAVSRKVLEKLSADPHADVRRAVARNSRCTNALLSELAKDEDAWVRAAVAYQKNATKRLLEALAEDADIDVLSGVANNPHTPQRILLKLISSLEADIRRGVILNRKAQRKTLLSLLEDSYYLHRLMLVNSTVLKDSDKWPLCDDPDFQVRFTAYQYFAKKYQTFTKNI